jgi:amino acid adenylation domain-containing protein
LSVTERMTDRIASLTPEQRELFEKLREKQRKAARTHQPPPVRRVTGPSGAGDWPLSLDQERYWFMEQLEPSRAGLNIGAASRMRGPLSVPVVAAALDEIVRRHAAWRTTFPVLAGGPVQRVAPARRQLLALVDLSGLPASRREAEALRRVGEDVATPFDLERGPLVRASLLQLEAGDRVCLLTVHHLVVDFLSFQIVWAELAALCAAFAAGRAPELAAPPVQYPDFAVWQREWLQGEVLADLTAWWRETLSGFPLALELPTDRPRPAMMRMQGGRRSLNVPPALSEALRALARGEGATPFMAVLAATATLLHRESGQERLILGANNANRNRPEIEAVLGTFLTQVPFAIDLTGDPPFRELLARVRRAALGAYAHQDLTFGQLVEAIHPERDTSRPPVVQTLVQVLDAQPAAEPQPGVSFEAVEAYDGNARYDLMLSLFDDPGGLEGSLEYDADLFDPATAERLCELLVLQIAATTADPSLPLSALPVLTPAARHQALAEWNDTARPLPGWTVPERFAAQAARTPEALAVVTADEALTFAELDRRAGELASRLCGLGVVPESRVALLLGRTVDMPVALLAVWKAGGAALPLDPASPPERLAILLADAEPKVLIHRGALPIDALPIDALPIDALPIEIPAGLHSLDLEDSSPPQGGGREGAHPRPEHLAYMIYTSGTTGLPKAVMIEHGSFAAVLDAFLDRFPFTPGDRMLHLARFSFDISLLELFAPLLAGAACEILSQEKLLEPDTLLAAVQRATAFHAVPSLMRQIVTAARAAGSERFSGVRRLFSGGDAVPPDLQAELAAVFPAAEAAVLYGPTETTIVCTDHPVSRHERPEGLPIGRPLGNAEMRVIDRWEEAPLGVPGELWIGGPGVARGYFRREELTAERFVERDGRRWYRTGDLVRHLADGTLEFLGRTDLQVKIRGFRVEPGEIEAQLAAHPGVREAVVVALAAPQGEKRLVAYWVATGDADAPSPAALRDFLASRLPAYMVPTAFVLLPELPLTAHGKLDRRRMPAPEPVAETGEEAPLTPTEELIAGIWSRILGVPQVSRSANFFELGGHSLLATQVVSRLRAATGAEVTLREMFEAPTVTGLAAAVAASLSMGASSLAAPPIRRVSRDGDLPLSFAQERLWFLDRLIVGNGGYHIPFALAAHGDLSLPGMAAALGALVARHEALRTTYGARGERPVQKIAPPGPHALPLVDLAGLPEALRRAEARRLADSEVVRPFDLERDSVLRASVHRLGPQEHVLLLVVHHIAADGWSLGLMLKEIVAFYSGTSEELPALPVQYADFAVWQREWLQGEVLERQLAYWRERLAGAPVLDLPTDRPRPPEQSFRGATRTHAIDAETTRALEALARRQDATLFMLLLAAMQTLLGRYTGQDDVVVGSPIAGRNRAEIEPLIGFFVNTLVLRGDLAGDPGFGELVGRSRRAALEAYSHQDLPFERLVAELRPERQLSHNPLFQVLFAVQNAPLGEVGLPGLTFSPAPFDLPATRFDLEVFFTEVAGELAVQVTYGTDLFDPAMIARLEGHLDALLASVLEEPARRLSELPILALPERHQLLVGWNDTAAELPGEGVAALFVERARRRPEAVAVSSDEGDLTYAELDLRSSRLASRLAAAGVGPEVRVALLAQRSPALIVGLLAILKAGGAYVPLDPSYPAERLAWMLADSRSRVLLGQPEPLAELPERVLAAVGTIVELTADPSESPGPEPRGTFSAGLAYVMYTSGSTGRPKGVGVTHRNVVRLVRESGFADLGPEQVFLQLAPVSFDASTLEIWAPLLNGGRLALFPPGPPSLDELEAAIARFGVTALWLTAGLFHQVVDERLEALRPLRQLLAGGDVLSPPHVRRALAALPGLTLIDGYGPTEGTTFTACFPMTAPQQVREPVPIGRPIGNTRVHLLGADLRPVPVGVWGELFAGGDGVSRGYVGLPDLTAERFVPDPFAGDGGRLYRTGDIARFLPDGRIEFQGRRDSQVKLRGFRVELGEIESALARHPEIREAAVAALAGPQGEKQLVAYLVPEAAAPSVADVRDFLIARLPAYMVPAAFVVLPALPLTANGKLDRRSLPAPEPGGEPVGTPPRTPAEELIAGIWSEVLGVRGVPRDANFFELGGHSLLATQVLSRLRVATGAEVTLREMFESPTVAAMAAAVAASLSAGASSLAAPPIRQVSRDGDLPLSFAQERLWFLDRLAPGNAGYHIPFALAAHGDLSMPAMAGALGAMVGRHEALRTTYGAQGDRPVQVIAPPGPWQLPLIDLAGLPEDARSAEARRLADEEVARPFDLARDPMLRAGVLRLATREHVLLLVVHHIAADGWSLGVMVDEIVAHYRGTPETLPELAVQYADFAVWQRDWLRGGALERQLGYWRERLAGVPALDLPTDRPRPPARSFRGATRSHTLDADTASSLKAVARRHDATLFMVLLSAVQTLLGRYAGQDDVVLGSPIANRTRAEIEPLIGFFVNTLVLRGDLADDPPFSELVARSRRAALEAYSHQDLPFERLVEELRPERRMSHNPLFQVMFAVQNAPLGAIDLPGLTFSLAPFAFPASRFDLELFFTEVAGALSVEVTYATDLFDAPTIARLEGHLGTLLREIIADPSRPLSELSILAARERHQLLREWNDTEREAPVPDVVALVAGWAARTPGAPAVVSAEGTLTYGELGRRSAVLAGRLRALGAGPDLPVGLFAPRSAEMVIGALAALKSGGAYLPLDPSLPAERLAFLVRESRVPVVLSAGAGGELSPWDGVEVVWIGAAGDRESEAAVAPDPMPAPPESLAYVLYTSGSTGRPKGVEVSRGGLANLVRWHLRTYGMTAGDRATQIASPGFDAAVWEVWPCLAAGAALHIPDEETRLLPESLLAWLAANGITLCFLPTPLAEQLLDAAERALPAALAGLSLRALLTGGDRLVRVPGRPLPFALVNHYGPTESSVVATAAPVPLPGDGRPPSIGRPIDGTTVHVVDRALQPLPAGVPGELLIGGAGLARGYLGRPDLTAERFIPDPFGAGRLYRTGDLVRFRPDGALDFLGRIDHQVKVRGYRIELGEIEGALARHPEVGEAAAVLREEGMGARLVAYVVPRRRRQEEGPDAAGHVAQWQTLYDETYGRGPSPESGETPTFNIQGWDSSYTGEPIPAAEMGEWVDGTVDRLLALEHRRVLEVGCGTGLLLFRVGPHAERYRGADFSAVALAQVRAGLDRLPLPQVELVQALADDWSGVRSGDFDLVVLNSVVQYFPGVDYLVAVLEGAVAAVAPGGAVFVGDVRSLPLLGAFHASVQLHRAAASTPVPELARRIARHAEAEEELVVDPDLFLALARRLPAIRRVQVLLKRGRHANELTRFRYDVVLHVGGAESGETMAGEDRDSHAWESLADLERRLAERPGALSMAGIPNARLAGEAAALERLAAGEDGSVGELRAGIERDLQLRKALDPEELWTLADRLGYDADLTWSSVGGVDGRFDARLRRRGGGALPGVPPAASADPDLPWSIYANDPLRAEQERRLVPELRRFLEGELPEYMVPAAFVLLAALPLNASGKIDRAALPAPESAGEAAGEWVPPATHLEELLARVTADVLGLARVGLRDNFFDLGGHSLLATQLVSRLTQEHGLPLTLRMVFDATDLGELADAIVEHELASAGDGLLAEALAEMDGLSPEELAELLGTADLEEEAR